MKIMGTEEKGGENVRMKPGRNDPCFCGSGLKFKKGQGMEECRGERKKSDEDSKKMSQRGLQQFGAYQKARELFDLVVADMDALRADPKCYRLIAQQVGSADSICANIEEGYGRVSRPEYIRFLDIARGSARETRGRYERMNHWLNQDIISQRLELLDEIIGILTNSIASLRKGVLK